MRGGSPKVPKHGPIHATWPCNPLSRPDLLVRESDLVILADAESRGNAAGAVVGGKRPAEFISEANRGRNLWTGVDGLCAGQGSVAGERVGRFDVVIRGRGAIAEEEDGAEGLNVWVGYDDIERGGTGVDNGRCRKGWGAGEISNVFQCSILTRDILEMTLIELSRLTLSQGAQLRQWKPSYCLFV